MKTFLMVLICGLMGAMAMPVYAAQPVQALITPAKFQFYGKSSGAGSDSQTINYNGNLYVPVRFVAESLGANIVYDSENSTVLVSNEKLTIADPRVRDFKVGRLLLARETALGTVRTKVTGQLRVGLADAEHVQVKASLHFFNDKHEPIGEVPLDGGYRLMETRKFEEVFHGDLRRYASVELRVHSMNGRLVTDEPRVPLTELMQDDFTNITQIDISYGPGKRLQVRDEAIIRVIAGKLRDITLAKSFHQEPYIGYLYFMDIYSGDKKIRYSTGLRFGEVNYDPTDQTDSLNQFIVGLK